MADRVIVVIDDRPGSAPGEVLIAIPESSPWHTLLPEHQVVEIFTSEVMHGR